MLGAWILVPIVVFAYIMLCYYIGAKVKVLITSNGLKFVPKVFWIAYWVIALSFIIGNLLKFILPSDNIFLSAIILIGGFYICSFIYLVLIFGVIDFIKYCFKKAKFKGTTVNIIKKIYANGLSVFLIVIILVIYGFCNTQNKEVTTYEVDINKSAGYNTSLNIVMLSDVHMGIEIKEKSIDKMIDSINKLNPDIVVFCGDIYDESTYTSLKEYSSESFENIKSTYGSYFITGNHEYVSGELDETIRYVEDGNVKVLKDEALKIDNSFYLVGRDDSASERITGKDTKGLEDLLKDIDKSYPIILLDHKPDRFEESVTKDVDLQLSGHTHKGQLSPGDMITGLINKEKNYGLFTKEDSNLVVSSGYGTWGLPARIGSKSEIVNIKISFNK